MLILCMGIWRHRNYELFYVSHVGGCVSALVLAYLHRPNWLKKIPLVMAFGGSIWLLDRIIRAARMSRNGINNNATLYPLPGNAIRILLRKPHRKNALPGSHCFLWIPCIHVSQNHPFTIVSNGPSGLELVVRPREGFTKETLRLACQRPGERFLASVDGPYGSVPEMKDYDRVVLMAGGSGAAYTVGLLNRVLSQNSGASLDNVYFIWTVRDTSMTPSGLECGSS
jgi:predicted ferric reductase